MKMSSHVKFKSRFHFYWLLSQYYSAHSLRVSARSRSSKLAEKGLPRMTCHFSISASFASRCTVVVIGYSIRQRVTFQFSLILPRGCACVCSKEGNIRVFPRLVFLRNQRVVSTQEEAAIFTCRLNGFKCLFRAKLMIRKVENFTCFE